MVATIKFGGRRYWALYYKNFHPPMVDETKLDDKTDNQQNAFHRQVYGYNQWIDDNVYNHISDETNVANYGRCLKIYMPRRLVGISYICIKNWGI